jgi:hypothetical protein
MTNSPGLVSESCHESTFKLIRHHNFNDVFFSVGATWTFNKYNNNCLYKTRWDSYPGIGEEKKSFLLKKLTQLFTHLFFLLNIQKQHTESIIYMSQTNKEYIFCTNFIKMYTECNEHHLN